MYSNIYYKHDYVIEKHNIVILSYIRACLNCHNLYHSRTRKSVETYVIDPLQMLFDGSIAKSVANDTWLYRCGAYSCLCSNFSCIQARQHRLMTSVLVPSRAESNLFIRYWACHSSSFIEWRIRETVFKSVSPCIYEDLQQPTLSI